MLVAENEKRQFTKEELEQINRICRSHKHILVCKTPFDCDDDEKWICPEKSFKYINRIISVWKYEEDYGIDFVTDGKIGISGRYKTFEDMLAIVEYRLKNGPNPITFKELLEKENNLCN